MPYSPRAPRVSLPRRPARLANIAATVINVSRTGALINAPKEWLPGSQLPLTIDLDGRAVNVTGTVVRSQSAAPLMLDGVPRRQFAVALSFVKPSTEAVRLLDAICGGRMHRNGLRLGPVHLSGARYCPRCFSRSVMRGRRRRYSCDACQHEFIGLRIAFVRIAF